MKRILILVLAMLLALGCACAEEPAMTGVTVPEKGTPVEIDLDGDGAKEQLVWNSIALNEYDEIAEIRIQTASGGEVGWGSDLLFDVRTYLTDMDADGVLEILITGDEMSADYVTYCLQYADGALKQLSFPDACRGENTGEYQERGYGLVESIDGNEMVLIGSQDVLGTYFARRTFTLADGRFEFADDGLWRVERDTGDPELWEYASMELVQDVAVTLLQPDGERPGTLFSGERVMIQAFDKISKAFFLTEDGREGYFTLTPDTETGWGDLVNGIPEDELFAYVLYAD